MQGRFEVTFPIVLEWDGSFSITFTLQEGDRLVLNDGIYYLEGDNGSGKTTFINMLALTTGRIGKSAGLNRGTASFNDMAYNDKHFTPLKAAEIREKYFCIYPQKTFFLPVSTRDNYLVLNGSDPEKAMTFSADQFPDLLSGGQQQKVLMDIVLDDKKPVWFLDEPLTNLDAERRHYFWETLKSGYAKSLNTAFFIDHWIGTEIKKESGFEHCNTLRVTMENSQGPKRSETEFKRIDLYVNNAPEKFFDHQIKKSERKSTRSSSV